MTISLRASGVQWVVLDIEGTATEAPTGAGEDSSASRSPALGSETVDEGAIGQPLQDDTRLVASS